jgi:uncharacterized protein YjbI with pentapeptide repeats
MAEKYKWCKNLTTISYRDKEGKEYCVFHAPKGQKGISLEAFNRRVYEKINKNQNEKSLCDFSGTIFDGDISFLQYNKDNPLPEIKFLDAQFKGAADFSKVQFSEEARFLYAQFSRDTIFARAKFIGLADFRSTKFSGLADFRYAQFLEVADFLSAQFSQTASFIRAQFSREASFLFTLFSQGAYYSEAQFIDNVNFPHTKFSATAEFRSTKFSGETYFTDTKFSEVSFKKAHFSKRVDFCGGTEISGDANFLEVQFSGEAFFRGKIFFKGGLLDKLTIKGKISFEKVDLKRVLFFDTDLRKIDFINCEWEKKHGRKVLFNEIKLFDEIQENITKQDEHTKTKKTSGQLQGWLDKRLNQVKARSAEINKVEILYRMLKQKYKDEHNDPEVSDWHYGEREMYRKESLFRRYFPLSFSNLYWLSSGYGERPIRAGIFLIVLIIGLSIFLGLSGLKGIEGKDLADVMSIKGFADIANFNKLNALILNTFQYALFREPYFRPDSMIGYYLKSLAQILIPIQIGLFAFAVRNRFRR